MSRLKRFYAPRFTFEGGEAVELDASESHHLLHVLRFQVDNQVEIFDGKGRSAIASVAAIKKKTAWLKIIKPLKEQSSKSEYKLTVVVAPPKKDFDQLVVRLAELGVSEIIPLKTDYSEVDLSQRKSAALEQRFLRLAIKACKQSGSNTFIRVHPTYTISDFDKLFWDQENSDPDTFRKHHVIVCDKTTSGVPLSDLTRKTKQTYVLIGPEGGWSQAERAYFENASWPVLRLPGEILRTATAAIAASSLLLALNQENA